MNPRRRIFRFHFFLFVLLYLLFLVSVGKMCDIFLVEDLVDTS